MKVKQIYELLNQTTLEVLGKTDLINEDLTGVVDLGVEIFNNNAVEKYLKTLIDHIGKVVFTNRVYAGSAPSVLMDGWEFGSILEKVQADTPEAEENESWELQDRAVYEENIFYKPSVSVKFFNDRVTFEIPISITDKQVKSAFSDRGQLNSFMSMLLNAVERSLTIKIDSLVRKTINNFIGESLKADKITPSNVSTTSTARVVNLLKLYNDNKTEDNKLTKDNCLRNPEFLRYAVTIMSLYVDRLKTISSLYNIGGKDRFTPSDLLHVVMLSEFVRTAENQLYSTTFHDEYVKLPKHEVITYWQGSGKKFDFKDTSRINITTSSGNQVDQAGILAVMFDREALGVTNVDRYTTSKYNAKAEFTNFWYKYFAGYFNDFNENFIVFLVA